MTMADTIAVMNQGRVEQLGPPTELYEHPATTFVANFLGQSNLVHGRITQRAGDAVAVDLHGHRAAVPATTVRGDGDRVLLGVRPEKIHLVRSVQDCPDSANRLPAGVVSDVSFTGVSTQYLVRMPWSDEIMVFEQNTGARTPVPVGSDVVLWWRPEHSFVLDADQDTTAGADLEVLSGVDPVGTS